jgi:hypothetical protein
MAQRPYNQLLADVPLWRLLAALLPQKVTKSEWYTPREISRVCGLRPRSIMHHCRALFPNWEGQYRLSREQAEMVLQRVCSSGRKLPSRESIEAKVIAKRVAK